MSALNGLETHDEEELLHRAASGDAEARGALIDQYRERLHRAVALRLDPRVRQRLDASDVLQEATIDALKRFDEYFRNPDMPLFLWLRFLTIQRVQAAHREHLEAYCRDARREAKAGPDLVPPPSSADVAAQLVAGHTSPSQAAMRRESQKRIEEALDKMDSLDREVIALRHVEQLRNVEVALCLDITPSAATKRYLRAMKHLREILTNRSGFSEG